MFGKDEHSATRSGAAGRLAALQAAPALGADPPLLPSPRMPAVDPADAMAFSFYWGSKTERPAGWLLPPEKRAHAVLWLILGGELHVCVAGEERRCGDASLVFCPPGVARSAENQSRGPVWVYSLGFTLTLWGGVDFFRLYTVPTFAALGEIGDLALPYRCFVEELSASGQAVSLAVDGWARVIVGRWLSALRASGRVLPRTDVDTRLCTLLAAVNDDPSADWSLQRLSELAHLRPARVRQLFTQGVGTSPTRYVLNRRIALACQLLAGTPLPVVEVGERCGFDDPGYFSRAFRRAVGASPSEYRQRTSPLDA